VERGKDKAVNSCIKPTLLETSNSSGLKLGFSVSRKIHIKVFQNWMPRGDI
jgi:hypothetical protein